MLIDFTFENYLSFKNRATISFVIPGDKEAKYTRYVLEVENGKYLLSPFAAIYGQNAAGKSNVIKALMDFVNLLIHLASMHQFLRISPINLTFLADQLQFYLRLNF
jgi:AAA15 family ATPase/GTPase